MTTCVVISGDERIYSKQDGRPTNPCLFLVRVEDWEGTAAPTEGGNRDRSVEAVGRRSGHYEARRMGLSSTRPLILPSLKARPGAAGSGLPRAPLPRHEASA